MVEVDVEVEVEVGVGVGVVVGVDVEVEVEVVVGVGVGVGVVVGVVVEVEVGVEVVVEVEVGVEVVLNLTNKEKNMNIDELTIKEVKHIQTLLKGDTAKADSPYKVGKNYFIRMVTHYVTGKVERVTPKEIVLSDAAWIADTGRFSDALKTGKLNEVEPFPGEIIIGRGAIVDACEWLHALPREQK